MSNLSSELRPRPKVRTDQYGARRNGDTGNARHRAVLSIVQPYRQSLAWLRNSAPGKGPYGPVRYARCRDSGTVHRRVVLNITRLYRRLVSRHHQYPLRSFVPQCCPTSVSAPLLRSLVPFLCASVLSTVVPFLRALVLSTVSVRSVPSCTETDARSRRCR